MREGDDEGTGPSRNAPIIVTALFGSEDFAWLNGLRLRHFPPERNFVAAHLTLFHHLPPSIARELHRRLTEATREIVAPRARIAGVTSLGSGVAFRIVSEELASIRRDLADAFEGLLVPQDRAGWRPHVTIQNKVSPTDAASLASTLQHNFRPKSLAITGLASWHYRGGPWDPMVSYRFK